MMIKEPYCVCPWCGWSIVLSDLKDFESYSKIEVLEHFEVEHPDQLREWRQEHPIGMPYTPIQWE